MEIKEFHLYPAVILEYFRDNSDLFKPPLESRLVAEDYCRKISALAVHFCALMDSRVIGFLACYYNNFNTKTGFITSFSVLSEFQSKGIGRQLLDSCLYYGRKNGFQKLEFEVFYCNPALNFFLKSGFRALNKKGEFITLTMNL
jgi:ribosomal protein S18 acetylase RimI-like enzyme